MRLHDLLLLLDLNGHVEESSWTNLVKWASTALDFLCLFILNITLELTHCDV